MNNYLILRSQNSPYNDVTKNSVLSFADMDENLIFLKGNIIYTAETNAGIVTLKKYNGEDITFIGGGSGTFSGGTVTGPTNFIAGLTANTISANTLTLNGVTITGFTSGTPFYLQSSPSTDAGSNKTSTIQRSGTIFIGDYNASTGIGSYSFMSKNSIAMSHSGYTYINQESYTNNSNDSGSLGMYRQRGTPQASLNLLNNDKLGDVKFITNSYGSSGGTYLTNSVGVYANENHGGGDFGNSGGTRMDFYLIPNGTNSIRKALSIIGSGDTRIFGNLTASTVSATTYYNLPPATFTGGTVNGYTEFQNGVNANSINATVYYNLPTDVFVYSGSYNSNTGSLTLKNTTGGTFNINGLNTGVGTFSGGTVTGATQFTGGLSATTISATTYLGIPTSLTGGTYSNGSLLFTNNTGGTVTINTSTNYAAGVISGATYTSAGSGQINLPAVKVALYNNATNIEPIIVYDIASGTTGVGDIPVLTDNDTNYIVIEYNGGAPRYNVYDNDGVVNDSSIVLYMVVYRLGNFVHTLEFGNQGAGLANKLNDRFIMTDRFGYESGLGLSLSALTGIVMVSAGVAWNGPNRQSLTAVNSSGSTFFKNYHVGGSWTADTSGDYINNTYYDNGTDIVTATAGKYLVNWYFRGQETNSHIYEVYSESQYDTVALAQLATEPALPELITSHAFLVGRIIVGVGATTGLTESAFVNTFQSTNVTSHNDLVGIQGGTAGQYYHLTSNQYNNLALTNTNNYFSVGQTINGNLSANTFTITSTPVNSNDNTQILTRNSVTGDIEYVDVSVLTGSTAPSSFNYGLVNAMINFNFLT